MISKSLLIASGNIRYLEHIGNPNNPTLIAIHGWLDNAASFLPLSSLMPSFNWILIDLPGHGESDHRPSGCHYHFIDWVEDLVDFIDALKLERPPVLVGHSMGGMISTIVAGLYPEKLTKLCLIDAAGILTQNEINVAKEMREAFDSRRLLKHKKKRVHSELDSAIVARQNAGELSYESAKLLTLRNISQVDGGFEWRTDVRLRAKSPLRINFDNATQIVSNIQAPTIIILGQNGYQMVKENYQRFKPFYNNHHLCEVPGHHHCHMDSPLQIAEQLSKFLL